MGSVLVLSHLLSSPFPSQFSLRTAARREILSDSAGASPGPGDDDEWLRRGPVKRELHREEADTSKSTGEERLAREPLVARGGEVLCYIYDQSIGGRESTPPTVGGSKTMSLAQLLPNLLDTAIESSIGAVGQDVLALVGSRFGAVNRQGRPSGTSMDKEAPTEQPPCVGTVCTLEKTIKEYAEKKTETVIVPEVGSSFDTLGEAYDYYNPYSWEISFGIRYDKSRLNVERTKCKGCEEYLRSTF